MRRRTGSIDRIIVQLIIGTSMMSCAGNDTAGPDPVASVTVTAVSNLLQVGASTSLTATVKDGNGNVLTDRTLAWSSSNSSIALVSGQGVVTGVTAGGPVTITAASEGKSGGISITVVPLPTTQITTGIKDVVAFLNQCPTTDPAYGTIRQDFAFFIDGVADNNEVNCSEPYSGIPIVQLTDELAALQTLRLLYYMSQGTEGKLPWTNQSLYDWMKSQVAGINFHKQEGLSACCDHINGKLYIITSQQSASSREFYRDWPGLSGKLGLFVHEARHVAGPGHVTGCPAFPSSTDAAGCDATYSLANLGSYGVQYWLTSNWATGSMNVGIGCASASVAQAYTNWNVSSANGYVSRFVTNPPATVGGSSPAGGPCLKP